MSRPIPRPRRMINIVCLKWGTKYGPEYVNRLYAAVKKFSTVPVRFWCFTENSAGIRPEVRIAPLKYSDQLDSWWNKISLFSNDLPIPIGEQIFYIDLDTIITGSIDELLTDEVPDIIVLRDFYQGIAKSAGNIGSGLMSWRHGSYDFIWQKFIQDPQAAVAAAHPHGDQWWVEHCVTAWYYWQDLFPNQVTSFKIHCREGLPHNARIVCYHGKPSIPESASQVTRDYKWVIQPQPWVLNFWKDD